MVDLSGGPDGPIEHGFSNSVFIIPGAIIFGLSVGKLSRMSDRDSLLQSTAEEMIDDRPFDLSEARDLPTEVIERVLSGEVSDYPLLDHDDLREVLLRRSHTSKAFFGYKLYKSLKEKELKREEKKMLKQKKKK